MIFVDGVNVGEPDDVALRDRREISADGIFIVVATISSEDGHVVADPEVIFRGVAFLEEADALVEDLQRRGRGLARGRGQGRYPRAPPDPGRRFTTRSPGSSTKSCAGGRWSSRSSSRSGQKKDPPGAVGEIRRALCLVRAKS